MSKKIVLWGMILFWMITLSHPDIKNARAASLSNAKTLILYDAVSGAIPDASRMSFADFPFGGVSPAYSENATILDTTINGDETFAGWVSSAATILGFPFLDREAGLQLNFSMQVESETHTRNTRSGFSVIVLDKDKKGIELSFGENEIWAKSDPGTGGLFERGESIAFATTGMTEYQLSVNGDVYTLTAFARPLLTGPVRDYSAFEGFPDPYETPNFLFLGDNTTSAQARIHLQFVSITGSEPVLPTSTSESLPTALSTPLPQLTPTAIPTPTPTPPQSVVVLCPSGWIFAGGLAGIVISRKFRRRRIQSLR